MVPLNQTKLVVRDMIRQESLGKGVTFQMKLRKEAKDYVRRQKKEI